MKLRYYYIDSLVKNRLNVLLNAFNMLRKKSFWKTDVCDILPYQWLPFISVSREGNIFFHPFFENMTCVLIDIKVEIAMSIKNHYILMILIKISVMIMLIVMIIISKDNALSISLAL